MRANRTDWHIVEKTKKQRSQRQNRISKERWIMLLWVWIANKKTEVEVFCLLIWMHVQPAGFGCGLSFNANGVPPHCLLLVLLHYIWWGWCALITPHFSLCSLAFFFSFHDTHAAPSVLFVLLPFHPLAGVHFCVRVSNLRFAHLLTPTRSIIPLPSWEWMELLCFSKKILWSFIKVYHTSSDLDLCFWRCFWPKTPLSSS